ncbi:MAG: chemotaxis protein CheY [Myxococcales bacterium]|nr:chemotaxis protein CheY [Myxococcales bacterium]
MTKRILLVEDNPTDEKLTVLAFKKCGVPHELHVVRDGAEALDYLRTNELPTVVLLDLHLPKIDGLEVLRILRSEARTRSLPIVILTSSREDEDIVSGYSLGANAYVRKPVEYAEFAATARNLGVFWLTMNKPPPGVAS